MSGPLWPPRSRRLLGEREAEQASGALDWAAVSPCLDDAVPFPGLQELRHRMKNNLQMLANPHPEPGL